MKAIVLKKYGDASNAFEFKEMPDPVPKAGEVLIDVAYSGLNFADVMARNGLYKEAPPLPCVLGYDVTGTVIETGAGITHVKPGDEVIGFSRFGGYAKKVITDGRAVAMLPANHDAAAATALATQYCTAWYAANQMANLQKGERVLIHAGAGGVGIALIQYAKYLDCEIFSTAGSAEKIEFIASLGVHHPIQYTKMDFEKEVRKITAGKGLDAIFDAVGGSSVRKGIKSLASGGRIVCYGASVLTGKNIFGKISSGLAFGIYHPAVFMMSSKSLMGLNMLKIADDKPERLQQCLQAVVELNQKGIFTPELCKIFPADQIAAAHAMLENRKSIGKVVLKWGD